MNRKIFFSAALAIATLAGAAAAGPTAPTGPFVQVKIENAFGNRALSLMHNAKDPANKGNQEAIIQFDYYGDATQKWRLKPTGDGAWIIENVHSGKALSTLHNAADPANKGNGEALIQFDYYGDPSQKWRLKQNADGTFALENVHSNKAATTLHNSKDPANKGNQEPIIQFEAYDDATMKWKITVVDADK